MSSQGDKTRHRPAINSSLYITELLYFEERIRRNNYSAVTLSFKIKTTFFLNVNEWKISHPCRTLTERVTFYFVV